MSTRRINDTVQDDAPISRGELAKFADDLVKRPNAAFRHASRRLSDIEQRLGKLGGNADAMRSNIHDIRGNVRHVKNDAEMIRPTFELIRSGGAGIGEPGVRAENLERRSQTAGPSIPFSLFCVWPHVWKSPTPRRFAADGPTIGDGNVGPQGPQKAGPFPERSGPISQGNQCRNGLYPRMSHQSRRESFGRSAGPALFVRPPGRLSLGECAPPVRQPPRRCRTCARHPWPPTGGRAPAECRRTVASRSESGSAPPRTGRLQPVAASPTNGSAPGRGPCHAAGGLPGGHVIP